MKKLVLVLILAISASGCSAPRIGGWVKEGVEPYSETWQKDIEY